jgi:hypothetical protein
MARKIKSSMPPDVDLWGDCIIRVTAVDPTTGATVSGVNVSNVTLQVVQLAGAEAELQVGNWQLVPGPGA